MKHLLKRLLPMVLVLAVCVGLLSSLSFSASAATVNYVYKGKYIYNWGTRGTLATFLSPNAEDFYEDNGVTYDELASYSGSSSVSSVPSSALYKKLHTLMKNAQTHETSYGETRYQYCYTDCENSGSPKTISSFYSGAAVGPDWDGNWNREHVWPNSKGDASGNGENDIMMLRPTSVSENSSRGNKAFGKSSGYFNPNSKNSKYDLRGDVARIILYTYVRWECVNTGSKYNPDDIFGTDGVIESKAVLLEWMEADPVDTWELGRNDSVEAITGTRNVFVDYPELAFLLFGADIPDDYDSPSSGGSGNAPVNTTTTTTTTRNNNTTTTTTTTTTVNTTTTTTVNNTTTTTVNNTTTTTVNNTTTTTGRNDDPVTTTNATSGKTGTTTKNTTNASTEPGEDELPPIVWIGGGAAILVIVAGLAIWYFVFYRKKKQAKIEE